MSVQEREDDSKVKPLVIAFDTLQVLGLVLLLALLAPALFSSNIKRTATWFGMIVSGIIYCASYLILMFIGGQGGSEPSAGVCLFQACLVHSTPIFGVFCALSFVTDLSVSFFCTFLGKTPPRVTPIIFLASSSLLFMIGGLEALVTGLKNPGDVRRNGSHLYCHITTPEIALVFCILGVIISFATIIAEVVMVVIMRKTIVKLRRQSSSPNIELPTSLLVRLFSFSVCICFVLCINVYSLVGPSKGSAHSAWYYLLDTAPIGGVVTFATQRDILYFYFRSES
ncbi:hypothetical protein ARMGADRAFT_161566 [Armillaria gallica]|uniref:G-protein coupled receptors family 1 profile domain-containing protein n=1 Tax=Armillaria gallica TaxID=47427 RepID=A0A2H3DLW5_ARMGA|nr:hypothetical protein ARMGADRAFT_161566 [Armillaria gallica]